MTVGAELRDAREKLGYDAASLADYLRIRREFIEAIESERFSELPSGAYAAGFVKSYAKAVGLDSDAIAASFRREQAHAIQQAPLTPRLPMVESRVPTRSLVVIAMILTLLAWLGWTYFNPSARRVAEIVPPVPARLQDPPLANGQPSSPNSLSNAMAGTAEAPAVTQPAAPVANLPVAAQPGSAAALPAPAAPDSEPDEARNDEAADPNANHVSPLPVAGTPVAGTPVGGAPAAGAALPPAAPGMMLGDAAGSRVSITAVSNSWIQVRDPARTVVFTGVLHPGDRYRVPNAPGYSFITGNAGGIALVTDNVQGAVLGAPGAVLRNVPLDPPPAKRP